jgi:phage terminase large subunit
MAAHVWDGKYLTQSQATVFRNWRVEEFETPLNAVHRFGADWGFANDPTVLIRAHIVGREIRIDYCEAGVGVEIDATPAMFDKVPNARRWPICADSARPETISYMRRSGFKMVSAIKGPGSIEEGVRFLKAYDIVVHPRCDVLLRRELENYSYKVDPATEEVLPILEDKYNNCIDALRYACEAVRRAGKPKDEETNKPKVRDYGLKRASEDNSWMTV